jgi:hypothetical protein
VFDFAFDFDFPRCARFLLDDDDAADTPAPYTRVTIVVLCFAITTDALPELLLRRTIDREHASISGVSTRAQIRFSVAIDRYTVLHVSDLVSLPPRILIITSSY